MAIFLKVLNSTDVERRLSVPENCIKAFPPVQKGREINLAVRDESGMVWTFRCRIPDVGCSKPVIFGEWFQFIRSKDVKPGDIITFHREKDQATRAQYKIEVRKRRATCSNIRH